MGKPKPTPSVLAPWPTMDEEHYYPLHVQAVGPPTNWAILSPSLITVVTHWVPPRSEVCLKNIGKCYWCDQRAPLRWDAWAMACLLPYWPIRTLHFTKKGCLFCPALAGRQGKLHGSYLTQYRRGSKKNSPLVVTITEKTWDREIPQAPDIRLQLARLYSVDPSVFGVEGKR